jgi:hypothetical protein
MIKKNMPLAFDNEFSIYNGSSTITNTTIEKIKKIHDYIASKQSAGYTVYILSSDAGLYEIPYNEWNKDIDLLLNGNLGYNGTTRIINELSQIEKPLFLKRTLGVTNWQESKEIEEFVTQNYKHTENIEKFRVFEK